MPPVGSMLILDDRHSESKGITPRFNSQAVWIAPPRPSEAGDAGAPFYTPPKSHLFPKRAFAEFYTASY